MKTRTILAIIFVGAVVGAFLARGIMSPSGDSVTAPSPQPKPAPMVETVTAALGKISKALALTGTVVPSRVARLASPAEGPITHIRVREGDRVKTDDMLLAIGRKKGVEALLVSLREELRITEDNLQRTRRLVASKALPSEHLDQAKTAYEKVRAELVGAEETARDHSVTAPWEGVVSNLFVREGEFVAPRAPLLEMYDPSSLFIRAAIPEKQAAEVATGLSVSIHLDAYPDDLLEGRIDRVYPYLDSRLRTRSIEILPVKPVGLLPGMFARLTVFLKTVDDAVLVPVEALQSTPEGDAVFVVKGGKALLRQVKIGIEEDNLLQIKTGVTAGDIIIVRGPEGLKDGAAVRFREKEKADKQPPSVEGDRK